MEESINSSRIELSSEDSGCFMQQCHVILVSFRSVWRVLKFSIFEYFYFIAPKHLVCHSI
jgi:hypothetical protein